MNQRQHRKARQLLQARSTAWHSYLIRDFEAYLADRDDDEFDDQWCCTHCGGEGWCEVDDPLWDECDEFGYGECSACSGTGERKHQTVF